MTGWLDGGAGKPACVMRVGDFALGGGGRDGGGGGGGGGIGSASGCAGVSSRF
jgi:hypothetical protein